MVWVVETSALSVRFAVDLALTNPVSPLPYVAGFAAMVVVILLFAFLIRVPDDEAWVIFNELRKAYSRTLTGGMNWLRPFEKVRVSYSLLPRPISVSVTEVKSAEGLDLPLVAVSAIVQVNPDLITGPSAPIVARLVADSAETMARAALEHSVRTVFGRHPINNSSAGRYRDTIQHELKDALADETLSLGIEVIRLRLGLVRVPAVLQREIAESIAKPYDTAAQLDHLVTLLRNTGEFSPELMAALEQARMLSRNGSTVVYSDGSGLARDRRSVQPPPPGNGVPPIIIDQRDADRRPGA